MNTVVSWLRTHWFRIVIAFTVLTATVIEWVAIPPIYPLNGVLAGISVACILCSPFLPRASSWLIIGTVVARLFVLDLSGPNPLWAAYLALAIIGYDSSIPVAIAALLVISVAECIPVATNSFNALSATWVGLVNYVAMFVFAVMIGMALRWRRQRDDIREQAMALERRQWELDTLQRNTRLASRIHDSASGGLSYIALTAQRQLRRIGDDAEHAGDKQDWKFVNDQALSVLDEIHHVIDLLEQSGEGNGQVSKPGRSLNRGAIGKDSVIHGTTDQSSESHPVPQQQRKIGTAVQSAETKLAHLGFHGRFELRGELPDDCTDESVTAAANLIGEIATNITRHFTAGAGEYCCVITLSESAIEIMETNPLPASEASDTSGSETTAGLAPHGSGLVLHRRIIGDLGGELNTSAEDGDWVIYARIPTRRNLDSESGRPS